jgi:uncharacterized membrane protein YkvA (DUF1232 family)
MAPGQNMSVMERLKGWARSLKTELYALYLAYRDPRVPWYARILAVCVVGYAFSPIDLIPDAIPILGYLDDLIIVPVGIWMTLKLIPRDVLWECRERANREMRKGKPTNWVAAGLIIGIWILLAVLVGVFLVRLFGAIWWRKKVISSSANSFAGHLDEGLSGATQLFISSKDDL